MNVLLLLPDGVRAPETIRLYKSRLSHKDQLSILTCTTTGHKQIRDCEIHELGRILILSDFRPRLKNYLQSYLTRLREISKHWPKLSTIYSLVLWKVALGRLWSDFLWNVRSLDPDLIDLRWMPNSRALKAKLTLELPQVQVTAEGDTQSAGTVDTSWRRYDPGLRVSIILPVYNGAQHLRQSIDSCLKQTHRNIELVIVDDCSTDATPNIISGYLRRDPRIITVRNVRNLHLPGALNVGFAQASGDLLTWTSHDNYYASTAIETLVRQLCSRQDVDLVYSAFRHVDEDGQVDPDIIYLPPPWRLPFINAVGACFLYRRAVYERTGEYRDDMEYEEDYEYWLRVRRHFNIMRLNFPLYYYRLGGSMAAHYQRHPELWGKARRAHSKQGTCDCC